MSEETEANDSGTLRVDLTPQEWRAIQTCLAGYIRSPAPDRTARAQLVVWTVGRDLLTKISDEIYGQSTIERPS